VHEACCESLGDQEPSAIAGGERGSIIEQRAKVEDLEYLGVGMAHDLEIAFGDSREQLRELAAAGSVDALQEPPVASCRERQVIVGQVGRPVSAEYAKGQVFIEDDQTESPATFGSVCVAVVPSQGRVGFRVRVRIESRLELLSEVAGSHAPKELAALRAQSRVTGASPAPTLLEELVTDAHAHHCAPLARVGPNA
jgi:hypothetical protein